MGGDIFTAGDLIVVTEGEYSDFGVVAIVRALKSFTLTEVKSTTGCLEGDTWEPDRMKLSGLIAAGFIEELPDYRELWLGR